MTAPRLLLACVGALEMVEEGSALRAAAAVGNEKGRKA